ncbi:spore coat protein YlbD [Piscibacillus halophilus]|uniref:Putative coat protein n=1 Tax=Piscibacillus halophilus TaxID=571933 RepID=A0A1H8YSE8_9BACI|nr:spore coat protein YlbD [Piscibacillus halophilus]SEP54982.1 Putative coat protein [Piscibacillus halophilus]
MNRLDLPEEVREFKKFVQSRQGLVDDVRRGKYSWQELFDIWYKHGEKDPLWEKYELITPQDDHKDSESGSGKFSNLLDMVSKIDFDQFEKQVNNLSKTIDQVQGFLQKRGHHDPYQQYNQRKRFF